jgi:hypothetical protein
MSCAVERWEDFPCDEVSETRIVHPERELKYAVRGGLLARFLRGVAAHVAPEIHDAARPVQYTRTTYLDTADRAYLRSGEHGPRVRLRIREYAAAETPWSAPALTGLCFLELKETEGTRRSKVRWQAPSAVVRTLLASGPLALGGADVPAEIAICMRRDRPVPVATTWYRRRSYSSTEGVRVTVDDSIRFSAPQSAAAPGLVATPRSFVGGVAGTLLEVKIASQTPAWVTSALAVLPEPTHESKFGMAMRALSGYSLSPG